jgi:hypothetical protein
MQSLAFIASNTLASVSCLGSDILVHVSSTWTSDIPPELSHKSVLIEEAVLTYRQCLTNSQEKALIAIINNLTNRNMPPTITIVKNLVEEIRGYIVRKN